MILAALTQSPPAPAGAEMETIRDIAPPVWALPYPVWMIVTAGLLTAALVGVVIWRIVRLIRNRPAPPPPSPYMIAARELERLRGRVREIGPYEFSIAVSDVLRTFVSEAKFHLPATQQTSPELLAAVAGSPLFSAQDRALLERFLEKCDMIKFARIDATSEDSAELVKSALEFVQGGRA